MSHRRDLSGEAGKRTNLPEKASDVRGELVFPPGIEEVFREFRTCEFSTVARDGTPITGLW